MKCPYCNGDVTFEPYVAYNVETYGKSVIGRTACCGKGLRVSRVVSVRVSPLSDHENHEVDSWGEVLEKHNEI